ncbi:hypothetical protein ASD19_03230 [Microbacterium sp. Root53]|jgi:hypothetical protein|nr:hypothetical protein ASD19_03230 [Microbacterium sp. Root53]
MRGVHSGSGPSSNVSATVPGAGDAVRGSAPLVSITGPPWSTSEGTRSALAVAGGAASPIVLRRWV